MRKVAIALLATTVSTRALAHGGHPDMTQTVHAAHHGLEALVYIGLGVAIGLGFSVLAKKFRGRS